MGRIGRAASDIVSPLCRPWALILTPGNTADCIVGPACVSLLDGIAELLGDKAYDGNSFRKSLRIATRYDKLARNDFSALCLVAAVAFWL